MIERLDFEQRVAALQDSDDLVLVAGPGGGKTAVLGARIASLIVSRRFSGEEVVALTYTRTMAADLARRIALDLPPFVPCAFCKGEGKVLAPEIGRLVGCGDCGSQGRIASVPPVVGTLHSLAARLVRSALRGKIAGGERVLALRWISSPDFGLALPEDVDDLVEAAVLATSKKVGKKVLRAGLRLEGDALDGWPREAELRRQLASRGLVTYDDLLVLLREVVSSPGSALAPHVSQVFPALVVDEAQDLAPSHLRLLDLWRARSTSWAGDDAQRIYSFLSKDEGIATEEESFVGRVARARVVARLGRNYRSAPAIIDVAHRLRAVMAEDGACLDVTLEAVRAEGESRAAGDTVGIVYSGDEAAAARSAAEAVSELVFLGFEPREIAVLGRTWEEILAAGVEVEKAGIKAAIPERGRDRWSSLSGRAVVALVRHASRGFLDEVDAKTIVRALRHDDAGEIVDRSLSCALRDSKSLAEALDADPKASAGLPARWWSRASSAGLRDLLKLAAEATPLAGPVFFERASEASSWTPESDEETAVDVSPEDWLLWLASDEASAAVRLQEDAVVLTTFHGAKGLEWPAVVVLGACEGSIPHSQRDRTPAEVAEAGRCLYVGVTRAREALRIVVPRELRGKSRDPSPWLIRAGLAKRDPAAMTGKK